MAEIDNLDRLQAQLMVSGLQQKDLPLFQVISQLIKTAKNLQTITDAILSGATTDITALLASTFLTTGNETTLLPNSKQLLAGTNITFDDSIAGQRTISSSGGGSGDDYVVMSDGATPIPEPVDDGFGNFVYVMYTP